MDRYWVSSFNEQTITTKHNKYRIKVWMSKKMPVLSVERNEKKETERQFLVCMNFKTAETLDSFRSADSLLLVDISWLYFRLTSADFTSGWHQGTLCIRLVSADSLLPVDIIKWKLILKGLKNWTKTCPRKKNPVFYQLTSTKNFSSIWIWSLADTKTETRACRTIVCELKRRKKNLKSSIDLS